MAGKTWPLPRQQVGIGLWSAVFSLQSFPVQRRAGRNRCWAISPVLTSSRECAERRCCERRRAHAFKVFCLLHPFPLYCIHACDLVMLGCRLNDGEHAAAYFSPAVDRRRSRADAAST